MPQKKETAVAVKEETGLSANVAMSSNIDVDPEIVAPPRIQCAQALSDVVKDSKVKIGSYYSTATQEDLGGQLKFIPLLIKQGAVYMTPEKGLVCRSADGRTNMEGKACSSCPHGVYHKTWVDGQPPACSAQINCIVVLPEYNHMAAVLSFGRSNFKEGKDLVAKIRWSSKINEPFEGLFTLGSKATNSGKGEYFAMKIMSMEPVERDMVGQLKEFAEGFKGVDVNREESVAVDDVEEPEGTDIPL
jgi:hypothetical protein